MLPRHFRHAFLQRCLAKSMPRRSRACSICVCKCNLAPLYPLGLGEAHSMLTHSSAPLADFGLAEMLAPATSQHRWRVDMLQRLIHPYSCPRMLLRHFRHTFLLRCLHISPLAGGFNLCLQMQIHQFSSQPVSAGHVRCSLAAQRRWQSLHSLKSRHP